MLATKRKLSFGEDDAYETLFLSLSHSRSRGKSLRAFTSVLVTQKRKRAELKDLVSQSCSTGSIAEEAAGFAAGSVASMCAFPKVDPAWVSL